MLQPDPGTVTVMTIDALVAGVQTTDARARSFRVGHSVSTAPREAAIEAAETALRGRSPKLLLVFAPCASAADEIAEAVGTAATAAGVPDIPVVGCSTTGLIGPAPHLRPDAGVVILGVGGDLDVSTACARDLSQRPREVGAEVAAALQPLPDRANHVAIVLTDVLAGDHQELIRGAYGELGATVPMVGAVAGSGVVPGRAWQMYGGTVMRDAVVAARLSSDAPIGISVRHGWRGQGAPMLATASTGNELYTLDDRPALDVFLARHGAPASLEDDAAAFAAFALARPLAISRRGELAIRQVVQADPRTRALICAAVVPKGAEVWLGTTDVDATVSATDIACAEAVAALGETPAQALLVFDCAARRAVLQSEGMRAELAAMRRHCGDGAFVGCYGNGEIARVRGANGFHNQTVVACAIG